MVLTRITRSLHRYILSEVEVGNKKDYFPLSFLDHVLKGVARHEFYCFLDGYYGYYLSNLPRWLGENYFIYLFGTFDFRRMQFGLCNVPATFQKCIISIFRDVVKDYLEVFMDDISVFRDVLESCPFSVDMLWEKHLLLNWEKCHFIVKKGIILGYIVSSKGTDVNKAKVKFISKIPIPKTVKDMYILYEGMLVFIEVY